MYEQAYAGSYVELIINNWRCSGMGYVCEKSAMSKSRKIVYVAIFTILLAQLTSCYRSHPISNYMIYLKSSSEIGELLTDIKSHGSNYGITCHDSSKDFQRLRDKDHRNIREIIFIACTINERAVIVVSNNGTPDLSPKISFFPGSNTVLMSGFSGVLIDELSQKWTVKRVS
jgi:hypothetical protein